MVILIIIQIKKNGSEHALVNHPVHKRVFFKYNIYNIKRSTIILSIIIYAKLEQFINVLNPKRVRPSPNPQVYR